MAPVLEKQLPGAAGAGDNNNEDEEGQNLWQVLLLFKTTPCLSWPFLENDSRSGSCFVTAGRSESFTGPASSNTS